MINLITLEKRSYIILAGLLLIFEVILICKGQWNGDFFEHSAVVNELSKNLFHPQNPIISSNTAHAFFSPYAVLVAAFSIVTGFDSIASLACFAVFNLILFLYSLYFFSKSFFQKKQGLIASLILIFTLIFWGTSPLSWSGFYHIFFLNYVLPYPSTFALSLTLFVLGFVSKKNYTYYPIIILFSTMVLITHPPTAATLFVGTFSLCLCLNNYSLKQCIIKSSLLIFPAILLSMLWPYFNILHLFIGNEGAVDFNSSSAVLYTNVLKKNWPLLLAIPSVLYAKKDTTVVFLALTTILLIAVFTAGYLFDFYGVSRTISAAMLFAHMLIAYTVVVQLDKLKYANKNYLILILLALVVSISMNFFRLGRVVFSVFKEKDIEYYHKFSFLKSEVSSNAIILSDNKSSWIIPTYHGKVISSSCADDCKHPLHWVGNYKERRADVDTFFKKETPNSIRLKILKNYQPDYILINYSNVEVSPSTHKWLKSLGETIYEQNNLELLKIHEK